MRAALPAVAISLALAGACAGPATQTRPGARRGFTIGGSSGPGGFVGNCDPCDGYGGASGFYVGYLLRPCLSLAVDSWGINALFGQTAFKDRIFLNYAFFGPSLRYWPRHRWFVEGGLGVGRGSVDIEQEEVAAVYGAAVTASVGRELHTYRRFVLDVQMRTAVATDLDIYAQAFGLSIGIAWY